MSSADAPYVVQREPILVVRDLSVRYGGIVAVNRINLVVNAGELVGLIGPNGAGKTSLIDALTGYAPHDEGSVEVDGVIVDGMSSDRRAHLGLVRTFQQLELFEDLTVEENVMVAAHSTSRGAVAMASRAIQMFDLKSVAHLRAQGLPAGTRRLVAVARAVAASPRLLLLDEPAAGLDTDESRWMGERLRELLDLGLGMLLVDHDMSLVLSVSDRIHVMNNGATVAEGRPAEISQNVDVINAYLGREG